MQAFINLALNNTPIMWLTQSLWRDEAFSVWIAEGSIGEIIQRTSGDFNPPLYYIVLHFWMKLFGTNEITLRSLSFIFFAMFLIVVYIFAKKIFKDKKIALMTTLAMSLNPMLLYHGFELRMYSLLSLFTILSMYFFYTKQSKLHILFTTLGLYTQPFMAFAFGSQLLYLFLTKNIRQMLYTLGSVTILYLPWIPTLLTQLASSDQMWMYPINTTLILAVLGNLFMGYEGTPGFLWFPMQLLSFIILSITLIVWQNKKMRSQSLLFYIWLYVPLILILLISLIKPLYVHRYLIYVTIAEVFFLGFFMASLKKEVRGYSYIVIAGFIIFACFISVSFHRKVPLRDTFAKINTQILPSDLIYAETPLVYYESHYYAPKNISVMLYNPDKITPPRYTGNAGMPENVWATDFPKLPQRAFMVRENGTFIIQSRK